jgi:hypothetical protein
MSKHSQTWISRLYGIGWNGGALCLLLIATGCGDQPSSGRFHSTAMEEVNAQVAKAMADSSSAAAQPGGSTTACAAYRNAAEALERAAKTIAETTAPAGPTGAAGWARVSETVKTQRARIDELVQRTCKSA